MVKEKEPEPEPSSDEEIPLEYDVLLYLKEDKKRRKASRKYKEINPCRAVLQSIVIACKKVFEIVYGILIILPKYMCSVKKPDKDDKAFKKPKKIGKVTAM